MPAPESKAADDAAPAAAPASQTLTVVWIHEGPVCVSTIDPPAPALNHGVCHCPACHGSFLADWDPPVD